MELEMLKKIIAEVLGVDENEITMETTFIDDLGADLRSLLQEDTAQFRAADALQLSRLGDPPADHILFFLPGRIVFLFLNGAHDHFDLRFALWPDYIYRNTVCQAFR